MSATALPGTRHDPVLPEPPPAPGPLLPRHREGPLLPRFHAEEQPGGRPADVHLPNGQEDDEC